MTYSVIYVQNGARKENVHTDRAEALADYEEKRQIDADGAFDDRFVSHVEDMAGERIHP